MKTIASRIREKQFAPIIRDSNIVYQSEIANIEEYQLIKFNQLWIEIQKNIQYYHELVSTGAIPMEIKCWDDFANFPVLTRETIQKGVENYIDPSHKITGWSVTGGSTGTPFRLPYGKSEKQTIEPVAWLGRRFYDIHVSDRMFHFWGHSHLFGTGWQRYLKQAKRRFKNRLLGYQVFSAYDLTPQHLRDAGNAILKMRPDFIIGYSRSLVLLAKENADQADSFRKLAIKAVIATTEAFTQPSDANMIEQIFGCPVGMEYGAAETGVIAYTHPSDQRYQVFWDTFLLEAVPINVTDAKLLLTTLYPRVMPLIRYDIGDYVRGYDAVGNSIVCFDTVLGRDNDLIEIGEGAYIHSVALIHCVQSTKGVLGVQIIQEKDNSVSLSILCNKPLSHDDETVIRQNLSTLDFQLSQCEIIYVKQLEQTIAGKTKWIVKK